MSDRMFTNEQILNMSAQEVSEATERRAEEIRAANASGTCNGLIFTAKRLALVCLDWGSACTRNPAPSENDIAALRSRLDDDFRFMQPYGRQFILKSLQPQVIDIINTITGYSIRSREAAKVEFNNMVILHGKGE